MTKTGQEGIARELIVFSLPLILSGILQQLYNWVDAFVVGNVNGELALAAVGATSTIVNFYLLAITGFTLGLSILFAQKIGKGEEADIPRILGLFSWLLGGIFAGLAAVSVWLTPALLRVMNTAQDTFDLAEAYLRIVFVGIPFLAVYNVYAAALRGLGDSRAPFLAVLISAVVNVILDLWLVAGLGWNVTGAAVATVASQVAMTIFLVVYSAKKYPLLRFRSGKVLADGRILAQGLRLGIPPMVQSSVNAFGSLILQNFMNGFGSQTVAAITTAYRVDTIVILPMTNLGAGISTFVAQSYGAGDERRMKKTFSVGIVLMAVVSLCMTALVIPFGGYLIALFGAGASVVAIGRAFFVRLGAFYVIYGLATAFRGYVEGCGDVTYSSLTGIAALLFRIFASYAFVSICGNRIIAYAEAVSWVLLLVLYLLRYVRKHRIPTEKTGPA